jgi:glutathione S-transferase
MLKIYGIPISVHTRKVLAAAVEKGLDYEIMVVVPIDPTTLPTNWAEISPTGKIPVVEDGDTMLADSTVVCAYLDRAYPERLVYPINDKDYIRALWLEEYADGTLFREVVHPLFFETFVGPKVHKRDSDRAVVDRVCNNAIPRIFGYLDSMVDDGFVAGGALTVADIAIASNLVTYQYLGFPLDRRRFPSLSGYFERVARHPSMLKVLREEQATAESMGLQRTFLDGILS